jgi:hypothetical protein
MTLRLRFSATTVKEWFQYRCERKAVYGSMVPEQRAAIPIVESVPTSLMAEEGQQFELLIAAGLREDVLRPLNDRDSLTAEQTRAFLQGRCKEKFAYQVRLEELPSLRAQLRLPESVALGAGKLDLLRRDVAEDGAVSFTVIDVKGTQVATLFHKAQVAYYAIALDAWLREYRIDARVNSRGEIWRREAGVSEMSARYESDVFALSSYENLVLDFFHHHVPRLATKEVSAERDTAAFHIYFKCEQCKYLAHCENPGAIWADGPSALFLDESHRAPCALQATVREPVSTNPKPVFGRCPTFQASQDTFFSLPRDGTSNRSDERRLDPVYAKTVVRSDLETGTPVLHAHNVEAVGCSLYVGKYERRFGQEHARRAIGGRVDDGQTKHVVTIGCSVAQEIQVTGCNGILNYAVCLCYNLLPWNRGVQERRRRFYEDVELSRYTVMNSRDRIVDPSIQLDVREIVFA